MHLTRWPHPTRWFGIRHCRWLWLTWRYTAWWESGGRYYWRTPHPDDEAYLDYVWRGKP